MKKTILTLILGMVTFCSNGQSFLSNYPKLTRKNLNKFFLDWKAYSDSIALKATHDSLMNRIQCTETLLVLSAGQPDMTEISPRYFVLPPYIKIERYEIDVDTVTAKLDWGFPSFFPGMQDCQYTVDSIMPILPREGLYLTPDINRVLSTFAGGLKKEGNKTAQIKKGNIRRIKKYIPVHYGHWGGYWWFTSFPLITDIYQANNLIAVMRRTSWCTGDVVWYIKENNAFVRQPKSVVSWIE